MDIPPEQIVRTVVELIVYIHRERLDKRNYESYHQQLYDRCPDFATRFPSLFRLVIDDPEHFPLDRLKQMLTQRESVRTGAMTPEAASIKVGQEYFDEFIAGSCPRTTDNDP